MDVEGDEDDHTDYFRCLDIIGHAFVVENTIYALSRKLDSVIALAIEKKDIGGDLEFRCSLCAELALSNAERLQEDGWCLETWSFVHLGKENFCFVQTGEYSDSDETQPIRLTYLKLEGEGKMAVTDECCYQFKLMDQHFHIGLCFSLPECKTTALNPCEIIIFNPVTGVAPKQDEETDSTLEPEVGKPILEEHNVTLPKDGALFNVQAISGLAAKSSVASEASTEHCILKRKASVRSDEEGFVLCSC